MASSKDSSSFLIATPRKGFRPDVRRLSSVTATSKDIKDGEPIVIMPPRLLAANRSHSHHGGFAASLSQARSELLAKNLENESAVVSPPASTPSTPRSPVTPSEDAPSADSFAFAFDIDGVLIRGGRPIPEAIEAMRMLNGENEYGIRM